MQMAADFLGLEWGFTGCDNTKNGNHVGRFDNSERHDGQFHGSPHTQNKIAIDVSIVEPQFAQQW